MRNPEPKENIGIDPDAVVSELVSRARKAQLIYQSWSQERVDEAALAAGWAIVEPERNKELAELAVRDTGLGNVPDKITKNRNKTLGLLRDLQGVRSVGVVKEYPERGLVEIARPVGIVAAVTPSTNPAATVANKIINALKGRNAIIVSPSPKGMSTCARLLSYIHAELERIGAPCNLVQMLPPPASKALTSALMRQCDLVVVTGSQNNVRAAYSCGTPAIGVGAGNVTVIVDDSADLIDATEKIAKSKVFDNASSCSSENNLILLDAIYDDFLGRLSDQGGVLLNAQEKAQLENVMWSGGGLSGAITAQSVKAICLEAGLVRAELSTARFLLVEENDVGVSHPFSGEKLSPVLTVFRADNFEDAFALLSRIYEYQGAGHSVGIHTTTDEYVMRLGLEAPVCRVIVNQAHCFANGGGFDNGLPFSLSMGCGTWGGNSISDNLNYLHYLNTTRIAKTIQPNVPDEKEIFQSYHCKYAY